MNNIEFIGEYFIVLILYLTTNLTYNMDFMSKKILYSTEKLVVCSINYFSSLSQSPNKKKLS